MGINRFVFKIISFSVVICLLRLTLTFLSERQRGVGGEKKVSSITPPILPPNISNWQWSGWVSLAFLKKAIA